MPTNLPPQCRLLVISSYYGKRREKTSAPSFEYLGLVARPVKPAEILTNPKARRAVEDEWEKLRKVRTWLEEAVREYDEVCAEALLNKEEVHFGRVFSLCHEKRSEDLSLSKYKGLVVFHGNQMTDQTAATVVFQENGSSACLLSASKVVDVISVSPGNDGQQADAPQAYTQAELEGKDTWIELPREQWPKSWFTKEGKPLY